MTSATAWHVRLSHALLGLSCTLACACAHPASEAKQPVGEALVVVDAAQPSAPPLYAKPSVYVWRRPMRVVALPGLGELFVGDASDPDVCKLVWARDGLDRLLVFEAEPCAFESRGDDVVCLAQVALTRKDADDERPRTVVVSGCAGENELLWHRFDERDEVGIGPRTYHRRCAFAPKMKSGCELTFLRLDALKVESNPEPLSGASLAYDEDGWRVCWLENQPGRAWLDVTTSDTCAPGRKKTKLELKAPSK